MSKKQNSVDWITDSVSRVGTETLFMLDHSPAKVISEPYQTPIVPVNTPWMPYGTKNNYPNEILQLTQKNSIIRTALDYKANVMSAGDFQYGYMRWDDQLKKKVFEQIYLSPTEIFCQYNDVPGYYHESLRDIYWWNGAYADLIKGDKAGDAKEKIVQLSTFDHVHVRMGVQNKVTGKKEFAYISADWGTRNEKRENVKEYPMLDPYYLDPDAIINSNKTRFVFPMFFSTPGQIYYQPPPWHSVVLSGWVSYLDKIPEFKNYMLDNLINIRWIIHIPDKWWTLKYGKDFFSPSVPVEKRKKIMETEQTAFTETLRGNKGAGKALLATYITDPSGKIISKWEVVPIKPDMGTGELLPESQEGANNVLFSLALHASLIGNTPGKNMGAGSGSDIRVSFNNLIIANTPHQYKAGKAFEFIARVNGWKGPKGEPIICRIDNTGFIQTLNQIPPDNRAPGNSNKKDNAVQDN
ncbi:MAG: hypothetical protein ACEQSL_03590 [Sediminibacterium sp.]